MWVSYQRNLLCKLNGFRKSLNCFPANVNNLVVHMMQGDRLSIHQLLMLFMDMCFISCVVLDTYASVYKGSLPNCEVHRTVQTGAE